jgi:DNA-directed RNA polymerase
MQKEEEQVQTVLDRLVADVKRRQAALRADWHIHTFYLKEMDPLELINNSYGPILKGLESNQTLSGLLVSTGRRVRAKLGFKQASVLDCHAGWFIVVTYIECGILEYILKHTYKNGKRSKRQSYHLVVKDYKAIEELWTLIDKTKVSTFPLRVPPADWLGPLHSETGQTMIKKGHQDALSRLPSFEQGAELPLIYRNLNKLQKQGWRINAPVFAAYQQCMRLPNGAKSPFKLHSEIDKKKQKSLRMEIDAIEQIALANLNEPFYHIYNYDFRGRIYTNTAYLHEQSSDNAKGLLRFAEPVPLGADGSRWLAIHTSNSFGNDKVSLDERVQFVGRNLETFSRYARDPMANRGWMDADKPFTFLACCYELEGLAKWRANGGTDADYPSALPVYIDGSNNGVQHLVAMSKDESIAHLVNLTPEKLPGDVYRYIAEFVWQELKILEQNVPDSDRNLFEQTFAEIRALQKRYADAPGNSEEKARAYADAAEWRNRHRGLREKLFPTYWLRIDNPKDQRKIVKRNVMTLGYGGTAYGMGQQIIDDTRDMSEYLRDKEHLWGIYLGDLVFRTCYARLPGPARMLRMFQALAERAGEKEVHLEWKVPVIDFPVVQAYRKPKSVRTKLRYGDEELKLQLEVWEEATVDKDAQKTGAAPNIVHSFDAAHLGTVVDACNYPVSVVHDSFGCHAGNMGDLFFTVREKFVHFYAHDPLKQILEQLDSVDLMPERGNLDLSLVLYSDYAFC